MASLPFCELAAELAAELVMLVTWFVVNSRKNIVEVSSRVFFGVQLCHERHSVFRRGTSGLNHARAILFSSQH